MKKIFPLLFLSGLGAFFFASCSRDGDDTFRCREVPEVEQHIDIELIRLDSIMAGLSSREEVKTFMNEYPDFHRYHLDSKRFPEAFVADNIFKLVSDPRFDSLNQVVGEYFEPRLPLLEKQLEKAFSLVKTYYPEWVVPKVYTAVTGFGVSLLYEDSIMIIGLDYFTDSTKYRPDGYLPNYILRRHTPRHLPAMAMLAVSKQFVEVDLTDNTLLNEMIKWGKTHYFVSQTLPCTHDSLIIGYTPEELGGIEYNQQKVWEFFIKNELFYTTNSFMIRKYVEERPFTQELDIDAPGRTGQWLGWRIVQSYAREKKESLPKIMSTTNPQKIFQESKYKPVTFDQ